jgi:hypothetical protein
MNLSINLAQSTTHHLERLLHDPTALARLHVVARHQLHRKGLPLLDPGDLIGDAVQAVLRGTRSRRHGRHPRLEHLASDAAFEQWLNGILESLASAGGKAARRELDRTLDLPIPTLSPEDAVPAQVDARLQLKALLGRLRQHYAGKPDWLKLIAQWEADGLRRYPGTTAEARVLRDTARELLHEGGMELN